MQLPLALLLLQPLLLLLEKNELVLLQLLVVELVLQLLSFLQPLSDVSASNSLNHFFG